MIRSIIRLQWLAALLLVASPAIGGQLLAVLHPCPAMGQLVSAGENQDDHGDHSSSHTTAPEHDSHDDCNCLGDCQAPAALRSAVEPRIVAFVVAPASMHRVALDNAEFPVTTPPHYLLPPKTAPPLI